MKKGSSFLLIAFFFTLFSLSGVYADVIFQDDFESGLGEWQEGNVPIYQQCIIALCNPLFSSVNISDYDPPLISFGHHVGNNINHYVYFLRGNTLLSGITPDRPGPPLVYTNFSTLNYENINLKFNLQTTIESNSFPFSDYTDLDNGDSVLLVYRIGNSGPWNTLWQYDASNTHFEWLEFDLQNLFFDLSSLDDKQEVQVGFTYSSPDNSFGGVDHFFIDDFQITGDPIQGGGPVCGNGQVESGEQCEFNNQCPNTECDNFDGCIGNDYYNYNDISNSCSSCQCQSNSCGSPIISYNDARCVVCVDNDHDGFNSTINVLCGTIDCNDNNSSIKPGAFEYCDNLDNDCDVQIDETFTDKGSSCSVGVGECSRTGVKICSANKLGTVCSVSPGSPTTEICDNKDNNCNGQTDEIFDVGDSCSVGIGECEKDGFKICSSNNLSTICNTTPDLPSEEICDNKDNNCNGNTDEDLTRETTCGVGVCSDNTGIETCSRGLWGDDTCDPFEGASREVCDGFNNDCDEETDEGFDEDKDKVVDCFDSCQASGENEPVDQQGCDIFQFCEVMSCGPRCAYADWRNNEDTLYPNDCMVVVVLKNGKEQQPKCVPTEFSNMCAG